MADGESSNLDSSSEEYDEETQPVVTQRDVFGSDTESDDSIPVEKTSRQKTVADDDGEEDEDSQEDTPSTSRSRVRRQATPEDDSGASSPTEPRLHKEKKKMKLSRRSVEHNLFSDDSQGSDVREYADEPEGVSDRITHDREQEADVHSEENGNDDQDDLEDGSDGDVGGEEIDEEDNTELDETKIAVDFPLIRTDLGKEIYLVKMPNFLSVETRPFDPLYYEDELDEDEVMDEEGRTRLKLKVENTIRWRKSAENENVHESNARIVKWSDGSLSLHLGDEIFDIHKVDIHADYNYLFIREGSGLQGQSALRTKLTFRPHSTDSFTHRKITLSLADKTNKSQKVKILPIAGADPETNRSQLVRREEEKLRASLRRESQLRRMRERQAISRGSLGGAGERRRLSSGTAGDYDEDEYAGEEEEEEDDGNTASLNALKRNAKAAFKASRKEASGVYSSESESLSDISEKKSRKKMRATISDEDSA